MSYTYYKFRTERCHQNMDDIYMSRKRNERRITKIEEDSRIEGLEKEILRENQFHRMDSDRDQTMRLDFLHTQGSDRRHTYRKEEMDHSGNLDTFSEMLITHAAVSHRTQRLRQEIRDKRDFQLKMKESQMAGWEDVVTIREAERKLAIDRITHLEEERGVKKSVWEDEVEKEGENENEKFITEQRDQRRKLREERQERQRFYDTVPLRDKEDHMNNHEKVLDYEHARELNSTQEHDNGHAKEHGYTHEQADEHGYTADEPGHAHEQDNKHDDYEHTLNHNHEQSHEHDDHQHAVNEEVVHFEINTRIEDTVVTEINREVEVSVGSEVNEEKEVSERTQIGREIEDTDMETEGELKTGFMVSETIDSKIDMEAAVHSTESGPEETGEAQTTGVEETTREAEIAETPDKK